MKIRIFALLILTALHLNGVTIVGTNTLLPALPASAQWQSIINLRPANGETVTLNPPIFSWFYSTNTPPSSCYDSNVYLYIFQADYNGTFTNPVVSATNYSDCYNFIAPFTNSPVYWRVAYMTNSAAVSQMTNGFPTTGWVTNLWITNLFYITNGTPTWDRSSLAISSTYTSLHHPYMFFNGANGSAISNFLSTNDANSLAANISLAESTTNQLWYTNTTPWASNPGWSGDVDPVGGAWDIGQVAMMWMLSGNGIWTNLICTNFDNLINYYTANSLYVSDLPDYRMPAYLSLTYDWLYPILTTAERTNAQHALYLGVSNWMNGTFWFNMTSQAPFQNSSRMGNNHGFINVQTTAFFEALASFNEIPVSSNFMDLFLNYSIARVTPYGAGAVNWGRSYGQLETFTGVGSGTINAGLYENIVFPAATLTNNPAYQPLQDWWTRMQPPGYQQVHEQWGDQDLEVGSKVFGNWARDFSYLTQSGNMTTVGQQMSLFLGSQHTWYMDEIMYPYFYQAPAAATNSTLGIAYPTDGWAFGSSISPDLTNCFYNGVGFIFSAKPRGNDAQHSHFDDTDMEIYAYGANVTDGGGGLYGGNKDSWMDNTIVINGLGQAETEAQQSTALVGQLLAFTNASDYIYVAGDSTQAYPHQAFLSDVWAGYQPAGYLMSPQYSGELSAGPLSYVSAVHRQVLFEHHAYFVIYDTIQCANAATNTFTWVYRMFYNSITNQTGGTFQYTAPREYFDAGSAQFLLSTNVITNYVFQVVNNNELSVTNMSGTNAYLNPFTGENLYSGAVSASELLSSNAVWLSNVTPTNNFHFMSVVYPVGPGGSVPTFTRLDDDTVQVQNGSTNDVISFNPQSPNIGLVTLLVDALSPQVLAPQQLRVHR